ncbi:MAG: hypothetical protein MI799_15875, partial [Desulfobacterales bacterium]|nr:hypothetical protein [Desulfobacterales bacterium]
RDATAARSFDAQRQQNRTLKEKTMTSAVTPQEMPLFTNRSYPMNASTTSNGPAAGSDFESVIQNVRETRARQQNGQEILQSFFNQRLRVEDMKPCKRDESLFPSFLYDPVARGMEPMKMVVSDEDGNTVAAVGESDIATIHSFAVSALYSRADGNLDIFKELLEENGFTVNTYQNGNGPTYAEAHDKMYGKYGLFYQDLIDAHYAKYGKETASEEDTGTNALPENPKL